VIRPGEGDTALRLRADRGPVGSRPRLVTCANADDEARAVADAVLAAHQNGLALRDQAVLMRTGQHSNQLEIELAVRKIPFVKYGGIEYTNTAHVRDLLAALRLVHNRRDEIAWFRLLCRHRAIGKATARNLTTALLVTETPAGYPDVAAAAPPKARTALHATLTSLAAAQAASAPAQAVEHCLAAVRPLIRAHYADWPRRVEDLDRLAATAAAQTDLAAFVADLTIDPASSSADYAKKPQLDEDYLTLSTVHSAKGLEWTAVHLIHAVDGAFPSDLALTTDEGLEEEQRLFYVAVTRARDRLTIYTPQRMPTNRSYSARHVLAKPSRFLTDDARAVTDAHQPVDQHHAATTNSAGGPVEIPTLQELFR
jgi:DNA helicase-2/ATP-dependent DNA helicase PcrA